MEEADESPVKRRRTECSNDVSSEGRITTQWTSNVEISALSVKPDKFQKLRKIAASCTEKIQNPKPQDVIISSVGSTPSSSPRPENLTALSNPLDPADLHARLTVLVAEEDKENRASKARDGNLQPGNELVQAGDVGKEEKISEGRSAEGDGAKDKNESSVAWDLNIPMCTEEFYAILRKMINEKMKKLEETYTATIIPDLERKIAKLEGENAYLQKHAKQLQEFVTKVAKHEKPQEKPVHRDVAVQAGSSEPPPLTPVVATGSQTVSVASKPAPVVHVIDAVAGLHKAPSSTTLSIATQVITVSGYSQRAASIANGIRHTAALTNSDHVFTSSAGQPRLYNDAPYRPGSNPNALVAPRTHTTFARPSAPITATVYPQPQNLPTSPNALGVPRNSLPTPRNQTSPGRMPYSAQNGVMIRGHNQAVSHPPQYDGAPRHSPTGPPPSYSAATARPQQQVAYHPGSVTNPQQVNGLRQYTVRQGTPGVVAPAHGIVPNQVPHPRPTGPPPLVRAQPNILQRPQMMQTNSPRYQTVQSHVIRQRPPYPQNTPTQVANDSNQIHTQAPRHRAPAPSVPPLPPQTSPSQITPSQITNGIIRDLPPPTPTVSISGASNGIVLSWNMTIPEGCAPIDSYQLFAYQNNGQIPNQSSLWKKLGIVKALPLPMACTLTQFVAGCMYYFAVRAIDIHGRAGSYSAPCAITLPSDSDKGRT